MIEHPTSCGTGDIETRIERAKEIYQAISPLVRQDQELQRLFSSFEKAAAESWGLMREMGIPEICMRCATQEAGGGCCGKAIDEWYDEHLLVMNLHLGVEFPERRIHQDGCRFLGEDGCLLKARYHFCVNYLCHRITEALPEEMIQRLKAVYGEELYLAWLLETRIMAMIPEELAIFRRSRCCIG